jgi:hypothetical protein
MSQQRPAGAWMWRTRTPAGAVELITRVLVSASQRGLVRSISVVWIVAVMLAAAPGAGSAHAQQPAGPATTVSGPSGDQSKAGPQGGDDKPKAEKPKVPAPDDEAPAVATPDVEEPTVAEAGKDDDGKDKPVKAKPAAVTPQPEKPKPAKAPPAPAAKAAQPKPAAQAKTAQPKTADAAAPDDQAPDPPVAAAKRVAPRPKAIRLAAPRLKHTTGRAHRAHAPGRQAGRHLTQARGPARPEQPGAAPAASSRVPGAAAPAPGHRVASTLIRAPRAAARGVAAASAAVDRSPPRVLILDAPLPSNAVLLLAGILTAALALFIGWQTGSWHRRR